MNSFDADLTTRLQAIREQGLYRELRRVDSPQQSNLEIGGRHYINFSSNDYLGLANHLLLKEAAIKAVETYGTGSGASRLICGSLAPHHQLEEALAQWKVTEAALTFSSGYSTAVGTICALLEKDDIVVLDKLVHASIVDAARLSGAKLRVFAHNDLDDLEHILQWATKQAADSGERRRRILIVTESVFSMDGDIAPLREIVGLKEKHGAWLMVDEAHATGIYGNRRCGIAEMLGVSNSIEIQMGTLGKALGSAGGYICGSRKLIEFLVNRARSFIFSTAPTPATAGAALAAVQFAQSSAGEDCRNALWRNIDCFNAAVKREKTTPPQAIIPIIVGPEEKAVAMSTAVRERGFFVPAIRYPTVARGEARLRVTITASHSMDQIQKLAAALNELHHA